MLLLLLLLHYAVLEQSVTVIELAGISDTKDWIQRAASGIRD